MRLTHGGDHVSCGALVLWEPKRCKFSGGEDDQRLGQSTQSLPCHHHREHGPLRDEAEHTYQPHYTACHVEPGAQDQLRKPEQSVRAHQNLKKFLYNLIMRVNYFHYCSIIVQNQGV